MAVEVTAGQILTAEDLTNNFNRVQVKRQIATETVTNSTTLISSSYLVFDVEASSTYVFDALIAYTASSVADFKVSISAPSGSTVTYAPFCNLASDSSVTGALAHDFITLDSFGLGGAGTGTVMAARPGGTIEVGGTAGQVIIKFAQNTAEATTAALRQNSWMVIAKVD